LARAHLGPDHIHLKFHGGLQLCSHGAQVHLPLPSINPLGRKKISGHESIRKWLITVVNVVVIVVE
jgi:hypothetical protein